MKSKVRLCNRWPGHSRCIRKKELGTCPACEGHCVSGLNLKTIISDRLSFLKPEVKRGLTSS